MDFGSQYIELQLGSFTLRLSETIITTWIIMAALIIFAVIVRSKLKKFEEVPKSGFQNVVEAMVEVMDSFVAGNMGDKYRYFGNWFFGVFAFILFSNLSGLLGFRAPTADLGTTAALALTTFVLIHFMGIVTGKLGYFKSYFEPVPFLVPLNIISEIATPVSLSFRLFGNLLGGTIIMGLVYTIPMYIRLWVPAFLHIYFDVFAGCLQTFIFVMLSMAFIGDKIADTD
ncbi:MAG: F0F1 ATP synthase subunit A [Clostridiales bacterium]|nr:F0F1 ATP synthase subunit A [Clostridiales bacterium]MCD8215435.1 F0F1 ATP synthase subunit A [Clostridiales bacterium]